MPPPCSTSSPLSLHDALPILPHIFTGLKVGAALAATAAVVAEFVASDKGLGYLLLQYNGQLDTPMVFATIVLLSLIGLVVYYARSEEHTSELQSRSDLVCRLL